MFSDWIMCVAWCEVSVKVGKLYILNELSDSACFRLHIISVEFLLSFLNICIKTAM